MSTTTHLICTTCKQSLWIGQGQTIYTDDAEVMAKLSTFLYEHRTSFYPEAPQHNLLFVDHHYDHMYDKDWTRIG